MIPLLPNWHLQTNRPSFYDMDSATLLELASTLHATMNSVIEEYNNLADSVNQKMEQFTTETKADQEAFQVGIRQEFQDFIDTINLMVSNLEATVQQEVKNAIEDGRINVAESYDPATESLRMIVTGGI